VKLSKLTSLYYIDVSHSSAEHQLVLYDK